MKFVSVAEMVAIEQEANAAGLSYDRMMENAGRALADVLLEEYGYLEEEGALGLIGSGNNGGDTLIALDCLAHEGWKCSAYLVRSCPDDDALIQRFLASGGKTYFGANDPDGTALCELLDSHGLLLDGILGTGFRLPLKPELAQILRTTHSRLKLMSNPPAVVAVDCPSGVDCDSGESAPECLPAEMTVTMAAYKQGLFKAPAHELAGEIWLVPIGLPGDGEALSAWRQVRSFIPEMEWVRGCLPDRPASAHKGSFGTAVIAAGSIQYTGAAWLAGQAAYRIGAGLVTLAVPRSLHAVLAGNFSEATWLPLPEEDGVVSREAASIIRANLDRATSLLVGPGLGLAESTGEFIRDLLTSGKLPPLVIDADGLKLLTRIDNWPDLLPPQSVLTPHPGEMSVLTGIPAGEIQSQRLELARRMSKEWNQVLILKGAFTVISAPDGATAVIPIATPALARAGTGDVLAGLVAGLLAQGVPAFEAAVAGAWIHAQAGMWAARQIGNSASVLAGDVLNSVSQVLTELQ